jgi:DNA-binding XRE family transcriptional regulator
MKLQEYREDRGLTYDELAVVLGLKRSTVFNACNSRGKIFLHVAKQIEDKTDGAVTIEDFLSTVN